MPTGKTHPKKKVLASARMTRKTPVAAKPMAKTKTSAKPKPAKVKIPDKVKLPERAKLPEKGKLPDKAKLLEKAKLPEKAKPLVKAKPVIAAKPVAPKTKKPEPVAEKKLPAVRPSGSAGESKVREKKYTELFGPSLPKGKGLDTQGEPLEPAEIAMQGWCLMQFPPRPGRLSWIYATHGLSVVCAKGKERPTRTELVMHFKEKDVVPLQVLSDAAKYMLATGNPLAPGQIVSAQDGIGVDAEMIRHCLACDPEPGIPRVLELPGGAIRPLILLGISDAEFEFAMKVRPDLADGRQVLMEALRTGGVFPVTDPKRQCLTRRRDFNRIWESAFRAVRERKV